MLTTRHELIAACFALIAHPDDEQLMVGIHSNSINPKETIHVWPTNAATMANLLCTHVDRNMTQEEWDNFATGLKYERTCENFPSNNK